jgi:integrase
MIIFAHKEMDMYSYSNNGITIASILDERRETAQGFPVKVRVTYRRMRKYYSTGKCLSMADWERLPDTKSKALLSVRYDIQASFEKVKGIVQDLEYTGGFSFDALNLRLDRIPSETVNAAFYSKIERLLENGQVGSHLFYQDALKSVEKFAGKNIRFDSITVDWLKKYEKHLLDTGRSYTTIGMYCRAIRCIVNEGRKAGVVKDNQYPFGVGKYEIPSSQSRKMALSIQQIKSLVTYTDGTEATEKYRDLWFFSYLCNGINFADLLTLKYSNIHNGEICFLRAKTAHTLKAKKEVCAIMTPEMEAIIDRWGNKDRHPDSYIFGYLSGNETPMEVKGIVRAVTKLCNKRLKKISAALGIEHISTYTARHSFLCYCVEAFGSKYRVYI